MKLLLPLLLLTPVLASAEPTLPEGFAGKLPEVMTQLYPKWEPSTQLTGNIVNGAIERARLRDAKPWESDGHHGVAILVQTWTGDGCKGESCAAEPADLAVIESVNGKLTLLASARGVFKFTQTENVSLDPAGPRIDHATMLLGVRDETERDGRSIAMLTLFKVEGAALKPVFERKVREARTSQKAVDAGCLAIIATDDLEAPPYPIKVTERCQQTKRSAVEFWRWQGTEYKLHGPASNAAEDTVTEDENDQ
jgi:hypothetical protein